MRWWSIPILAALAWFVFTLTPFWTLYDLGRAVQAGDTAYVERHVNFRALRLGLTKQFTAALKAGSVEGESRERQRVADAASALALPLAEALITPTMVIDLLNDGWPQGLDLPNFSPDPGRAGEGLRVASLSRLADFYLASELRGLRTVVLRVPPDRPAAEQFKIRMRLRDWSWHIIDIELNEALRQRIASALARSFGSRGGGRPASEAQPAPDAGLRP